MAQQTFNDGELRSSIRSKLNQNATETQSHVDATNNPHAVTAAQVGAMTEGATRAALNARNLDRFESAVIFSAAGSDITTGTVVTHRTRRAFSLSRISASVSTAPVGSAIEVEVKMNGDLVGTITIDAGGEDSLASTTPADIPLTQVPANAEWTFEPTQVGSSTPGEELVVYLEGYRAQDAFMMTIDTALGDGVASMTIPAGDIGTYDAVIDWGDGTTATVTAFNDSNLSHSYASGGTYQISITGTFPHIYFNDGGDCSKVTSIDSWGDLSFASMDSAFNGCSISSLPDGPITGASAVTDFYACFRDNSLTSIPAGLFDSCTLVTNFVGCFFSNSLTSIPAGLFNNCTLVTNFVGCFYLNSLTSIPAGLFDSCTLVTNFYACFANNSLTSIPAGLFDNCTQVTNFWGCFANNSLTAIPTGLFDNCTQVTVFASCFDGNTINTTDYSNLLVQLELTNQNNNVSFGGGNSQYNLTGQTARNALIADHNWTFTDGGLA